MKIFDAYRMLLGYFFLALATAVMPKAQRDRYSAALYDLLHSDSERLDKDEPLETS